MQSQTCVKLIGFIARYMLYAHIRYNKGNWKPTKTTTLTISWYLNALVRKINFGSKCSNNVWGNRFVAKFELPTD